MQKVETWLPVFPGFYETGYDDAESIDSELERISEQALYSYPELDEDIVKALECRLEDRLELFDIDYKGFETAVGKVACEWVSKQLNNILEGCKFKITFQGIWHPREYNFENDVVNCVIEFESYEPILDYLGRHDTEFSEYLKKNYTSGDGFISAHSNRIECWLDPADWGEHKPGAILDLIIRNALRHIGDYRPELLLRWYVGETVSLYDYINGDRYEELVSNQKLLDACLEFKHAKEHATNWLNSLPLGEYEKRMRRLYNKGCKKWIEAVANELETPVLEDLTA